MDEGMALVLTLFSQILLFVILLISGNKFQLFHAVLSSWVKVRRSLSAMHVLGGQFLWLLRFGIASRIRWFIDVIDGSIWEIDLAGVYVGGRRLNFRDCEYPESLCDNLSLVGLTYFARMMEILYDLCFSVDGPFVFRNSVSDSGVWNGVEVVCHAHAEYSGMRNALFGFVFPVSEDMFKFLSAADFCNWGASPALPM